MPEPLRFFTLRIPNGTALSTQVQQVDGTFATGGLLIGGRIPVGMMMPAAWTAAVITIQTSSDGNDWRDLYDRFGAEVTITTAASRRIAFEPWMLPGVTFIRFRSGTGAAPVNQGADRDLVLLAREFE